MLPFHIPPLKEWWVLNQKTQSHEHLTVQGLAFPGRLPAASSKLTHLKV